MLPGDALDLPQQRRGRLKQVLVEVFVGHPARTQPKAAAQVRDAVEIAGAATLVP